MNERRSVWGSVVHTPKFLRNPRIFYEYFDDETNEDTPQNRTPNIKEVDDIKVKAMTMTHTKEDDYDYDKSQHSKSLMVCIVLYILALTQINWHK